MALGVLAGPNASTKTRDEISDMLEASVTHCKDA